MITVYSADATDFATNGLGTLSPESCLVTETLNGNYEVTLVHPIDEAGKFLRLAEENIIRVPVPAGKTPYMQVSASSATSKDIYKVDTVSGKRLYLRAKPSQDAKGIKAYAEGTEVVVIDNTTNSQWSEVTTPDGKHGWMWTGNLVYVRTETTGAAAEESVREATTLRDQPFRIYKVVPTLDSVTVYARHIFYDLMDNMVSDYKPDAATTGAAAFAGLAAATEDEHEFAFYSDLDSTAEEVEIIDKNPAEAILGDGGLIEHYGGEIQRDWWDVYLAKRVGEETDIQIREGKNLTGISYSIDTTNAATRIIPKGEDADGNPLYLPEKYIENTAADRKTYANNKWYVLEVKEAKEKTSGDEKRTKEECYSLMREAVEAAYSEGADLPDVTLQVDFIDCAETEEYRQYRNLQGIHMGDTVRVLAKRVGVEVAMRMTQYTYNCLTRQYVSMTLGTIDQTIEGNMINPRSIGSGAIKGSMIKLGSVGTGHIEDGAVNGLKIALAAIDYAHIGEAAINQLSANAIQAIRADIRELVAGNITTDQLYADLAQIAAAQITAANIENANIDWATIENLTARIAEVANAEIEKLTVKWADIDWADIDLAQVEELEAEIARVSLAKIADANIDYGKIVDLVTQTAIIETGVGGELYIRRLAVTEANMVSLTVGALMVKAEDGSFKQLVVDSDGNVTGQTVEVEGDNIAAATIPGGKLIENTITARELNVGQIFADEALIRAIKAANIDVADLFASDATVYELDNYILRTTTIEALKGSLDVWASDKIRLEVNGIQVGGRNLLPGTKELPVGGSAETDKWWIEAVQTRAAGEDGFYQIDWNAVDQAESMTCRVASPVFQLPDGWLGRKTVASLWVYSDDWSRMTDGMVWRVFVTTGERSSDYRYGRMRILNAGGELADDAQGDGPENGTWKRVWAEFDLTQDGLPMSGAVERPEAAEEAGAEGPVGDADFGIIRQPQDVEVEVGSTVALSIEAVGAVSYQWQNSVNGGTTWSNSGLTGFNTDTLTFAMTEARYKYIWRCVITDADGNTLESRGASLLRPGEIPAITQQPVSVDAVVGDTVVFSVAATGAASYRWYNSNNGVTWTATGLTGYNTAALTVPATAARYNYLWKCILTRENSLTLETDIVQIRKPLDQATHAWIGYYCTQDAVLSLKMPKMEFGSVPTDWTPAPEDAEKRISEAEAELLVQAGGIAANTTAIENVQAQADSTDVNLTGVTTRVTTAEANISALDNKISSKVEQTDFDELGNIVSQQGTEISQTSKDVLILAGRTVGGTNMLRNTAELKVSNYSFDSSGASKTGTYAEDGDGGLRIVNSGSNVRWWLGHVTVTPGQQYAMSVRYKMNSGTSPIQFQYVYHDASATEIMYGDSAGTQTVKTEDGWVYLSDVLTVPDNAQIAYVGLAVRTGLDYELYTCDYNVKRPKFEMGSMPTDWSPHPEEFQAGSSAKITKDEIRLSAPKTTISIPSEDGEQVVAKFDSDGITGITVTAKNLAYCYTGPDAITVNPNAASEQIASGGYYKSLAEACTAVSGKYLGKAVTINVQGDTYGDAVLRGIVGGYPVTINGGGYSLYGTLTLTDCSACIYAANLSIARPASNGYDYAVKIGNCAYVELYPAVIDGGGAGNALYMETGSTVWAREVELYNATHLIHTLYGADLTTLNLRGGDCTNFICTDGSVVKMNVTRPDGAWLKHNASIVTPSDLTALTVDSGSAQPSTPTVTTAAYLMTNSDSYMGGGWSYTSDNDIWQGYTANRGRIRGCMWFDLSALSGKTIRQASMRLSMYTGYGRGVAVGVQLYGTNMAYSGRSGSPELTTSYGTIGSTTPGETNELTIPNQAVADLANGTIKALVLYSDDTAVYEGKAYSRNYARFYGESTGDDNTKPRLTVVYEG